MPCIVQDNGTPEGDSKCLIGPTDTYWRGAVRVPDSGGCLRMCMPEQAGFPEGSITCINNGYRVAGIRFFRKGMYVVVLSSSFVHELNPIIGCHMNRG